MCVVGLSWVNDKAKWKSVSHQQLYLCFDVRLGVITEIDRIWLHSVKVEASDVSCPIWQRGSVLGEFCREHGSSPQRLCCMTTCRISVDRTSCYFIYARQLREVLLDSTKGLLSFPNSEVIGRIRIALDERFVSKSGKFTRKYWGAHQLAKLNITVSSHSSYPCRNISYFAYWHPHHHSNTIVKSWPT
jgi:hypothetical protein